MINWSGAKVLVCGGAGMIGSHLSRELLKRGAKVAIADNLSSGSMKNIQDLLNDTAFYHADLREKENCEKLAKGKDAIFQLGAFMGGLGTITKYHADIMYDNALINLNMIKACHIYEIENVYLSSSACIYPVYKQEKPDVEGLKEVDAYPADCNEPYGWEKLFSEILYNSFALDYGMNIRIGRFHNIMGECYTAYCQERGKAPAHLTIKAIKHPNPPFTLWGNGHQTRSFCYISDCIEGVLRLMDSDYSSPINIGSDRLIRMNDLAKMALMYAGKSDVKIKHDLTKPVGVIGRNSDNTLVKAVLDWEPKVSLEEGMERMYEFAVEHYEELENI